MNVEKYLDQVEIVNWRRYFHENPELSFHEYKTSAYIEAELEKIGGIEILKPTPTSVIGVIKGAGEGKTIGLRADIDALPITEETEYDFKSKEDGVMHACGHDTHAAMLLGAAKVLANNKDSFNGTVKLIFQHAEELLPGGAIEIVKSGLIDDLDQIYGMHIVPNMPIGHVMSRVGPVMASADTVKLKIQGKGAHGSTPDKSIDPIMIGSLININVNHIMSRNISSFEKAVISTGVFQAGAAANIIPDTARLEFTVRTMSEEVRMQIKDRIESIIKGICEANDATYELDYELGYSVTINDEECVENIIAAAEVVLGADGYEEMPQMMGSEDFSAYRAVAPAGFMALGGGVAEEGYGQGAHHPKFCIDEGGLIYGTKMHIELIKNILGV